LILVTRNAEDFAQFSGSIVENWFDHSADAKP
jgi:predicted nucleic acid-binding protein